MDLSLLGRYFVIWFLISPDYQIIREYDGCMLPSLLACLAGVFLGMPAGVGSWDLARSG